MYRKASWFAHYRKPQVGIGVNNVATPVALLGDGKSLGVDMDPEVRPYR